MIVESSRLACLSSRQSNPPDLALRFYTHVLFFAKATAAMHQSPESNRQDWLLHWVLGQATAAMHRSSESNRQDWLSSMRIFGSFGQATAAMDRSSESNRQDWLLLRASLGPLAKRRLRCTDLPNPSVRIGFHAPLSVVRQATAAMH
jgi:hypothetical protein